MGGGRRPTGQDVQAAVTISLEEAYSGTRKSLEFGVEEPCPTCHGAGNVSGKPCTTCRGSGWQVGRHDVDVKIPAGVRTGQKVRVSGQGAGGGDLYLVVTVTPHRDFERRGDDVHATVPITAPEAALGVTLEVATLRGKVSMKVPPATSSGRTFRLPGFASPRYGITTAGTRRRLRGVRGGPVRAGAGRRPLADVEPVRAAERLGHVSVRVAGVEHVMVEVAADLDLAERRARHARERLGGKLRLRRRCSA